MNLSEYIIEAVSHGKRARNYADIESLTDKSAYIDFKNAVDEVAIKMGTDEDAPADKLYSNMCVLASRKDRLVHHEMNLSNATSYIVLANKHGQVIVMAFLGVKDDARLAIVNTFEECSDNNFVIINMYDSSTTKDLDNGVEDFKKMAKFGRI